MSLSESDVINYENDKKFWESMGFRHTIIETSFRFDSVEEARKLLGFYFGEKGKQFNKIEIQYRVALYESESKGMPLSK